MASNLLDLRQNEGQTVFYLLFILELQFAASAGPEAGHGLWATKELVSQCKDQPGGSQHNKNAETNKQTSKQTNKQT